MKDLHLHTKYSDGEFDEHEILKELELKGIREFAITDHDTIVGSKKVFELLKSTNYNFVFHTGIELTCRFNDYAGGVNMHILFYDFDYNDEKLLEIIKNVAQLRLTKIDIMVNFIEKEFNVKIPREKIEEKRKKTMAFGKPHLYTILSTLGNFDREKYYRTMDNLDTGYLKLDTTKTIKTLKGRGKLVLAHPVEIMREYNYDINEIEKIIFELKALGLDGVETYHSKQTKEIQESLSKIAKKFNLIETSGSDFHGPNVKPGLMIGDIQKQ